MSNTIFFISDTHFGHKKMVEGFDNSIHVNSGKRPFETIEEHDETLVKNWNSVVKPNDTVYHLGDAFVGGDISDDQLSLWARLNGRINYAPGNHCTWNKIQRLAPFCNKVQASYEFRGSVILQHIPVHPSELSSETGGRFKLNIHGHLHRDLVMKSGHLSAQQDERYVNVSCEQINYTPISWDEIKQRVGNKL